MAKLMEIRVRIVGRKGHCSAGLEVGDEWIVGDKTPLGICNAAYISIYPYLRVLRRGGTNKHHLGPKITRVVCPDAWNPVVFELSPIIASAREIPVDAMDKTWGYVEHLPYKKDYP